MIRPMSRRIDAPESYAGRDSQFAFAARVVRSLAHRNDEDALIALRELRELIAEQEVECGRRLAAEHGYSLADLARFSGISRQAAHKRYG